MASSGTGLPVKPSERTPEYRNAIVVTAGGELWKFARNYVREYTKTTPSPSIADLVPFVESAVWNRDDLFPLLRPEKFTHLEWDNEVCGVLVARALEAVNVNKQESVGMKRPADNNGPTSIHSSPTSSPPPAKRARSSAQTTATGTTTRSAARRPPTQRTISASDDPETGSQAGRSPPLGRQTRRNRQAAQPDSDSNKDVRDDEAPASSTAQNGIDRTLLDGQVRIEKELPEEIRLFAEKETVSFICGGPKWGEARDRYPEMNARKLHLVYVFFYATAAKKVQQIRYVDGLIEMSGALEAMGIGRNSETYGNHTAILRGLPGTVHGKAKGKTWIRVNDFSEEIINPNGLQEVFAPVLALDELYGETEVLKDPAWACKCSARRRTHGFKSYKELETHVKGPTHGRKNASDDDTPQCFCGLRSFDLKYLKKHLKECDVRQGIVDKLQE